LLADDLIVTVAHDLPSDLERSAKVGADQHPQLAV
jgi:hypothetical protein